MEIESHIIDDPYHWKAAFSLEEEETAFRLSVRLCVKTTPSISSWQMAEVQMLIQREFERYFDQRFVFILPSLVRKDLLCTLEFADDDPHLSIRLHPGLGKMDLTNWYLQLHPIHIAHELGHQLGLLDEYMGPDAPNRINRNPSEAFEDHSLMGNFTDFSSQSRSIKKADIRLRHGIRIAELIAKQTGRTFSVALNRHYTVRKGDGLSWISLRYFGTEDRWRDLYYLNRDRIPARDQLPPGTKLEIPR